MTTQQQEGFNLQQEDLEKAVNSLYGKKDQSDANLTTEFGILYADATENLKDVNGDVEDIASSEFVASMLYDNDEVISATAIRENTRGYIQNMHKMEEMFDGKSDMAELTEEEQEEFHNLAFEVDAYRDKVMNELFEEQYQ